MSFPTNRMRRLRRTPELRRMVRETEVTPANLIAPLFLVPGSGIQNDISSLPGQRQLSPDNAAEYASHLYRLGIPSVILFGLPESKDERGSSACDQTGPVHAGIKAIKDAAPEMVVITDLCFCEYTSHGHCGIMKDGCLQNDETLEIIVEQTLSHARAGADMIAPSGMLDGAVGAMRNGLDQSGFQDTPIMAYSAKFASGFYGPFREAVDSAPEYGDRKAYQMDPANTREALREIELDIEEGADIVMVKPALAYLDIISKAREEFDLPIAAYNVSGEYAMVKAAAQLGWINEQAVRDEMLLSIKRAGADQILTYFAEDFAKAY